MTFHVKPRLPAITADWLLARCVESAGCLVWTGSMANGSDPQAKINRQRFYVRRAIWSAMHDGRQPRDNFLLGVSCGVPGCVEPSHVVARTRSQMFTGLSKSLATRAKIAETKRKASHVPQERIPDIIASTLTGAEEAKLHGYSKDMVNRIRAGQFRKDYRSPFMGLGGAHG